MRWRHQRGTGFKFRSATVPFSMIAGCRTGMWPCATIQHPFEPVQARTSLEWIGPNWALLLPQRNRVVLSFGDSPILSNLATTIQRLINGLVARVC